MAICCFLRGGRDRRRRGIVIGRTGLPPGITVEIQCTAVRRTKYPGEGVRQATRSVWSGIHARVTLAPATCFPFHSAVPLHQTKFSTDYFSFVISDIDK